MNENYNHSHQLNITCTSLYIRQRGEIAKRFYIQKSRHFSKSKTISVTFLYKKARHFTLRDFPWIFWSWHFYIKSISLCVKLHFYIKKARQLAKNKTICLTFLYTKIRTVCVSRFFMELLKLAEGGAFLYAKNNALCVTFLYTQINAPCVTF